MVFLHTLQSSFELLENVVLKEKMLAAILNYLYLSIVSDASFPQGMSPKGINE